VRPADNLDAAAFNRGRAAVPVPSSAQDADDDVIRIEDLSPRENVKGGRKIILGEVATRPEDRK
jgi:hypothetical protein